MNGQDSSMRAPRGRPKKRPDYDLGHNINELLERAVSLAEVRFDDREERPPDAPSISFVAEQMQTSRMRVRKLLVTAGYYTTDLSRKVQRLHDNGFTIQEISERLGISRSAVHSMLPHEKVIYKLDDPTPNAEQCQQYLRRKACCTQLKEHLDEKDSDEYLWEAIKAFEHYHFIVGNGQRIQYVLNGDNVCFESNTITRKEVMVAFHRAKRIQDKDGCICAPAILSDSGAQELYTMFLRFGVCSKSKK